MNHASVPDPDDSKSDDDAQGGPAALPDRQDPAPEHLARLAQLVEQGLPPALRGDGTGFD